MRDKRTPKDVCGEASLEVVGAREDESARGSHACLPLARPFFLMPAMSCFYDKRRKG